MSHERLAIDGKGIRCTVTDYSQSYQNFISTVSVYSHERGIVLRMQPMSNKKISEVAIVQQLISESVVNVSTLNSYFLTFKGIGASKIGCIGLEMSPSKKIFHSAVVAMLPSIGLSYTTFLLRSLANLVCELFLKHNAPSPINCTKFFLSLYETTLLRLAMGGTSITMVLMIY